MAYENDILTRNDNDELAVRTVQSVGDNPASSYDDVYTRDNNGKLAVRVVGTGGGDSHNKGSFLTPAALREAYPTAEPGDFAIVESTDTIWVWDSDGSDWKDADQKGQVTSVNGQTGVVVLTASDVGAATTAQGAKADTAVQPGDLATVATTGAYSDLSGTPTIPDPTQVSTLPTASADELGNIYQFVGTTDANYTNGYFYECVSDGQATPTYSWTQKAVQPSSGGLPSQTGNAGKFLTTDGTDASWSDKPLVNNENSSYSIALANGATANNNGSAIGYKCKSTGGFAAGSESQSLNGVGIGVSAKATAQRAIALGYTVRATGAGSIQIGSGITLGAATNSDANTMKVANDNGNFEMMSADGTIPAARHAALPAADGTYTLQLVITNGVPTLSWVAV